MDRLRRLGRGPLAAMAVTGLVAAALVVFLALGLGRSGQATTPSPTASPPVSATAALSPSISPSPTASPTEVAGITCPLNGLPVDDPALLDKVAIAVQIENHPLARPARNLSNADMVVEAPVEGDATRFSAIFLCRATDGLTGPIRSARYYEIDLWQDLGVLPVGFGASTVALQRFAAAGMPYVNGITGSWPWFMRHGTKPAPHNLYGNIEALRGALGGGGTIDKLAARVRALRPPFAFSPGAVVPAGRPVTALEIKTNPYWRFGWWWDATAGLWDRQDAGKGIVDEVTGKAVTAASVVVQRVTEEIVYGDPDPGGNPRRLQHLVGHGNGTLYTQGRAIDLHWSRPTAADGTSWVYADTGLPVTLAPGVVWWEIVPVAAGLTES
jgi:Protein of unknown function (DUF3048) N-terminal domain/Protein of unknown function (DUF3048) C-terminal domain